MTLNNIGVNITPKVHVRALKKNKIFFLLRTLVDMPNGGGYRTVAPFPAGYAIVFDNDQ